MLFMNRADKIFLAIATLIVAIFSYFLYDDSLLFKDNTENMQGQIGSVLFTKKDVRLKSSSSFAWKTARKKVDVYQKDSIFTGEGSEVSIELNDGSIINLKENSLVTLNSQNGEMTLDLKYGDFIGQLNADSKLKVTAGKEEYDLKGAKSANNEKTVLQLNKSRSGQLDIKLQRGAAAVKTKKQTKILEKDRSISLANKLEEAPRPNIKLLLANNVTFKQLRNGDDLPLVWSASQKVPQFKVEIARDPSFTDMAWNGRTTKEKLGAPLRAGEGEFFWRVKALSVSGQELNTSAIQTFKVVHLQSPILLAPEQHQSLTLEMSEETAPENLISTFRIAWKPTKDSKKYHYQISENVQFEKIIKEQILEDLEVLSPALAKGEYFVRVRGELNDDAFSDWSEVHSLKMDFHLEEKPAAPRLVKNKIEFTPPPTDQRKPSSDSAPTLAWEKPVGISDFKVQIGKTKDFNQAKVYAVSGDQLRLKEYSTGKTYFRVFSISNRGLASLPSEVGMVSVSYLDPKINPLKDIIVNGTDKMLPAPSTEMSVGWTPVPGAQKYLLEMDESDAFKNSKKFEVNSSSVPVILEKPGTFHVRVVALNKEGQIISHHSPSEKFQYIYRVPLSMPLPLEPFDKTTVFMQQDTEAFVWLEWKSVNDVKVYQLDLSTSPTFDTIALSTQTKEPRYLIKNKLPSGKIYWRVRALSESIELSSDWTKPREFSILFKRNETFR